MVKLTDIVDRIEGARVTGPGDTEVAGITVDSREVEQGCMFVARMGARFDGNSFIPEAVRRGAAAVMTSRSESVDIPHVIVPDTGLALGPASSTVYGDPTRALNLTGITGTNGKTTVAYILESIIRSCGFSPGVMGTVSYRYAGNEVQARLTTAEACHIHRMARRMLDAGVTHLVMEVSSHALDLHRVDACSFNGAVYTNLSQDHLDYHGDMESYGKSKVRLFSEHLKEVPGAWAVINADDEWAGRMAQAAPGPVYTYSTESAKADIHARRFRIGRDGISADIRTPRGPVEIRSRLWGKHNLENILAAFSAGYAAGLDLDGLVSGIESLDRVPGRLELVHDDGESAVLVDYAHTPQALSSVIDALRPLTPGRLVVVFGCGGDRDRAKRPLMGQAVAGASDIVLVTTDNPRTEDPSDIIAGILPGVESSGHAELNPDELGSARNGYHVQADRRKAIRLAVRSARKGDTVLIAGKGHEDYQILGEKKIHFDDREEVIEAVRDQKGAVV